MLVIRMQRTGRKGHAQFRVVVQDSRRTPTSGKIVAALGHFNPHTKETSLNKEKASFYLEHGAQPSERVVRLLKSEGVKLPNWVAVPTKKTSEVKNADKRRSTRPASAEVPEEKPADAEPAEAPTPAEDAPVAETAEETADAPVEEVAVEATEEAVPAENVEDAKAEEAEAPAEAEPAVEAVEATEEPAPESSPQDTETEEADEKPAK